MRQTKTESVYSVAIRERTVHGTIMDPSWASVVAHTRKGQSKAPAAAPGNTQHSRTHLHSRDSYGYRRPTGSGASMGPTPPAATATAGRLHSRARVAPGLRLCYMRTARAQRHLQTRHPSSPRTSRASQSFMSSLAEITAYYIWEQTGADKLIPALEEDRSVEPR